MRDLRQRVDVILRQSYREALTAREPIEEEIAIAAGVSRIADLLLEMGWCPNHNRPCPWGCEMVCFLEDDEWHEPEEGILDTRGEKDES